MGLLIEGNLPALGRTHRACEVLGIWLGGAEVQERAEGLDCDGLLHRPRETQQGDKNKATGFQELYDSLWLP